MLKGLVSVCVLGASLILMLGLAGATTLEFGSKVVTGDADEGRLIYNFSTPLHPSLGYWDIGEYPGVYDKFDPVYLDIDNNSRVDANDIRLTNSVSGPAGSKVRGLPHDNDINAPLSSLPFNVSYIELDGIPGYSAGDISAGGSNSGDTVYLTKGPRTVSNDVRLHKVDGLCAGSKVGDFDPDNDKLVVTMMLFNNSPQGGPIATLRFYNANGNYDINGKPVYDGPDQVYLDVSLPNTSPYGFVAVNDIRLTSC